MGGGLPEGIGFREDLAPGAVGVVDGGNGLDQSHGVGDDVAQGVRSVEHDVKRAGRGGNDAQRLPSVAVERGVASQRGLVDFDGVGEHGGTIKQAEGDRGGVACVSRPGDEHLILFFRVEAGEGPGGRIGGGSVGLDMAVGAAIATL